MLSINREIEKLLIYRSIYDSLIPLIQYCENDSVFLDFIDAIYYQYDAEKSLTCYTTLAHLIRCHPSDEYEKTFTPSELQESFRRYLVSWNRLNLKKIPFEQWSDLAEEGVNLLKSLINENRLENFKESPRYKDFMKRFIKRHEDLRLSGKHPDLNELMDD